MSLAAVGQSTHPSGQESQLVTPVVRGPLAFDRAPVRPPLWSIAAPESLINPQADRVIFGDGAVFVVERFRDGGTLTAVDERSGKSRWSVAHAATPAAFANDTVFAVRFESGGSRVVALDSRTGLIRWSTPGTSVNVVRQLAIVSNGLHLEARDARAGTLRWSAPWNAYAPQDVRLIGTTLLLQTFESGATIVGVLYAYDIADGRPLWTKGNVNRIIGADDRTVAVDSTWGPGAYATYGPLTTTTIALRDGSGRGPNDFVPDPDRWNSSTDMDVHFAHDAATDGDALVFRIGPGTVYRYAQMDAPSREPPARYLVGSIARAGADTWLARLPDGGAGVVHLDPRTASVQPLAGIGDVTFDGVFDGVAFVAGRGRAVTFDPQHPADGVVSQIPCATVTRAFRGDGMLVAVCSEPVPRLVALAIPASAAVTATETPVPIRAQAERAFALTIEPHELPHKFLITRGAAFSSDGTLWFCEHALFVGGISGHTDFIGHLTRGGTVDEFPVPTLDANVVSIARGPDGAMWFTESSAVKLGRIAADGSITEFALPAELDRNPVFRFRRAPTSATPAPATAAPALSSPVPASAAPVRSSSPPPRGRVRTFEKLGGIVAGPDGALWLTAPYARAVARVSTGGDVRVFALSPDLLYPGNIARGPDGALWIAARDAVVRLSPRGDVRSFPLDTRNGLTSIVWGPDGNLWFSFFDGRAGRITPTGRIRVFAAPVVAPPSGPLIGGCDGALYVADRFRPALWRLSTAGEFTEHDLPFAIESLARAPDCTLGATESQAPAIGHVGTLTR